MAKKEYAFYPGCSSQLRASAANYLVSTNSICKTLDIEMTAIPDWNCCGASISYAGGSELSRLVMNARNFALSAEHLPGQDVVATCAACWLGAKETKEKLDAHVKLQEEIAKRDHRVLGPKLGLFIFEFQRTGIAPTEFLDRLEAFLAQLSHLVQDVALAAPATAAYQRRGTSRTQRTVSRAIRSSSFVGMT